MTVVVAHRTCPRDARENSLEGIEVAAKARADVVEVDARRSRNGTAVLLHDPWLGRVQKVPLLLKWANDTLLARLRVPTLRDALETARGLGIKVAVDTKDPGAAEAVLRAVDDVGAQQDVLFWSQHMPVVRAFVRALPEAEVALIRDSFTPEQHDRLLADAEAIGARAVSVHEDAGTPAFTDAAALRGLAVYRWYQPGEQRDRTLANDAATGLKGVVTDWPRAARRVLEDLTGPEPA
jgi:myo-inositol-1(or 4)-monophosphatase/deoxyribonuclease-2